MENTFTKAADAVSDTFKSVSEVTKERVFAPMYFYFIIAWIITNWKFVYTLMFVDNQFIWETQKVLKVDYLVQMYSIEWFTPLLDSILELLVVPLISSFVLIWWLSILSEMFFRKYEEHQVNKRVIRRDVEYREKVHYAKAEREIREEEFDNPIKYQDNRDFNERLDEDHEELIIAGIPLSPSEALYKADYLGYKAALDDYINQQVEIGEDTAIQAEVDRRRGK